MNNFQIEGSLHSMQPIVERANGFTTRTFVLEIADDKYPQFVEFQLTKERTDLVEMYTPGNKIIVHFDLRGREWNGKYITNLNAWRITPAGEQKWAATTLKNESDVDSHKQTNTQQNAPQSQIKGVGDFDENLPF